MPKTVKSFVSGLSSLFAAMLLLIAAPIMEPVSGTAVAQITVLHSFSGPDGESPIGELVLGQDGSLFGTTIFGGEFGRGTVYRLMPPEPGRKRWRHKLLHSFSGPDGADPQSEVIWGPDGALFGTTTFGGAFGQGTVYQLMPPEPGRKRWRHKLLHSFSGADGATPIASLVLDADGSLYGATSGGGDLFVDTVFRLKPKGQAATADTRATYAFRKMFDFNGTNGEWPAAPPTPVGDGTFLVTAFRGGKNNTGTLVHLQLRPNGNAFRGKVVHHFPQKKGAHPHAAPVPVPPVSAAQKTRGAGVSRSSGQSEWIIPASSGGKNDAGSLNLFILDSGGGWIVDNIFDHVPEQSGARPLSRVTFMPDRRVLVTSYDGGVTNSTYPTGRGTVNVLRFTQNGKLRVDIAELLSGDNGAKPWGAVVPLGFGITVVAGQTQRGGVEDKGVVYIYEFAGP